MADARGMATVAAWGRAQRVRVRWSLPWRAILIGALCSLSSAAALALDRGVDRGVAFITGGVGVEEREEIARWESSFNVKIVTATQGAGAFIASVHVDIHRGQELVFDRTMDGPWMLLRLPPGQYVVTANAEGRLRRANLAVPSTGHVSLVLRWEDREPGAAEFR